MINLLKGKRAFFDEEIPPFGIWGWLEICCNKKHCDLFVVYI